MRVLNKQNTKTTRHFRQKWKLKVEIESWNLDSKEKMHKVTGHIEPKSRQQIKPNENGCHI